VEGDDQPAHPAHFGTGLGIDVLPQHAVVLLVHADRARDVVRLARRVVQGGVQVADLAQAVAAELE
jgi:hypothetical protein